MSANRRLVPSSRRGVRTSASNGTSLLEQETALKQRGYYSDIVGKSSNAIHNVRLLGIFIQILLHCTDKEFFFRAFCYMLYFIGRTTDWPAYFEKYSTFEDLLC